MQVELWVLLVLSELLLATTILTVWTLLHERGRVRRERLAVQQLVDRIKEGQAQRREETRKILVHQFGFPEAGVEQIVTHIDREEKRFLQTMFNAFLQRDSTVLENLNIDFEAAVGTYRELHPQIKDGQPDTADSNEILRLKEEKEHLAEELRITMETMGRMLNEYASMYTGGAGDPEEIKKVRELLKKQGHPVPDEADIGTEEVSAASDAEDGAASEVSAMDEPAEAGSIGTLKGESAVEEITLEDSLGVPEDEMEDDSKRS